MENKDGEKVPNVKRDGWSAEEVAKEATNKEPDEVTREMARGSEESKKDGDNRDIAGAPESDETPHGREETKKQ